MSWRVRRGAWHGDWKHPSTVNVCSRWLRVSWNFERAVAGSPSDALFRPTNCRASTRKCSRWRVRLRSAIRVLNFDKLLFIKRHDSVGVFHMCDQYYGCNAKPGGGLFVLARSVWRQSAAGATCWRTPSSRTAGCQGQKLERGSFLSPELSFDGRTILFAYSQAQGLRQDPRARRRTCGRRSAATTSSRSTPTAPAWCS